MLLLYSCCLGSLQSVLHRNSSLFIDFERAFCYFQNTTAVVIASACETESGKESDNSERDDTSATLVSSIFHVILASNVTATLFQIFHKFGNTF